MPTPGHRRTPPGRITVTDALLALQGAVGAAVCPLARCDVDANGSVTSADALRLVQAAVGAPLALASPDRTATAFAASTSTTYVADECFEDEDCQYDGDPDDLVCEGYECVPCERPRCPNDPVPYEVSFRLDGPESVGAVQVVVDPSAAGSAFARVQPASGLPYAHCSAAATSVVHRSPGSHARSPRTRCTP